MWTGSPCQSICVSRCWVLSRPRMLHRIPKTPNATVHFTCLPHSLPSAKADFRSKTVNTWLIFPDNLHPLPLDDLVLGFCSQPCLLGFLIFCFMSCQRASLGSALPHFSILWLVLKVIRPVIHYLASFAGGTECVPPQIL